MIPIPIGLLEQLERGNVLLFVGEGVNQGMPSERGSSPSADLARELARRCEYAAGESLALSRVAYLHERRFGRTALISFLRDQMWDHTLVPLRAHQLIANLPVPIVVTTTYDDMLERVHREANAPYVAVVSNQDIPYADRHKRLLIWLLGRLDQPESLVLTELEQAAFLEDQRSLSDVLRAELAQRTWLILGFNLRQAWFRTFYASVMHRLDFHGRQAYFYGPSPGGYIAEWCREHNIEVLTPDVTAFLEELSRALTARRRVELPETEIEETYPEHPYKGLRAFAPADRRIFFGRERETQRLADLVRAHRLVVLYGASGTGKTSLVQAGLMPLLEHGKPPYTVVVARALGDPVQAIRAAAAKALSTEDIHPELAQETLVDSLAAATRVLYTPLVVVIDQFEEFFVQRSAELRGEFIAELAGILNARNVPVKVVLSLREEWLAALDEVESVIPNLYDARFRLLPLDREAARAVVEKPVEPFGVHFEPALVDHLLDDLGGGTMMPPQVQLVCEALYDSLPRGQREITSARYVELGGALGILGRFLQDELARVSDSQRALAQGILEELVSSQRTKTTKTELELEHALEADTGQLQPILHTLAGRLLHVIIRENAAPLYELTHEYLVAEIRLSAKAQVRKQAEELVKQELENWRRFGTLLAADKMALVSEAKEELRLSAEAQEFLLRSAPHAGYEMSSWMIQVEDEVQRARIMYDCLHDDEVEVRLYASRALQTWDVPEASRMLVDVILEDEATSVLHQAAKSLSAMEHQREAGLTDLLAAAQSRDRERRHRAIDGLAWYLYAADSPPALPRRLERTVQIRLARIRLRTERPQIIGQARAGGLGMMLGALPFVVYLALSAAEGDGTMVATILVVLTLLCGLGGVMLSGGLAVVHTITREWNATIRFGSMGLAGVLLGSPALLPVFFHFGGWITGLALGLLLTVVDVTNLRLDRRTTTALGTVVGAISGVVGLLLAAMPAQSGTLLEETILDNILPVIAPAMLVTSILSTFVGQLKPNKPGEGV